MWANWRLEGCVLLFLVGHLLLGFLPMPALWGLDLLSYAPWWYALVFLLVSLGMWALCHWPAVVQVLPQCTLDPWRPGLWGWLARLLIVAVALAFFVGWRSQVHLLGDGYLMLRELAMFVDRAGNEPLALWLLGQLYAFAAGDAEGVYRLYSYGAGIAYVAIALMMARALATTRDARWLVFGMLVTAGYMQLFCGYVETYPPLFAGALLYLLAGLYVLRGRLPLWVLSGGLALLMTYHFIAITLAPSLLLLAWFAWRRGHLSHWSQVVGGFAVGPVVVLLVLYGVGVDLFAYATGLRGGHLLPVFADPDYTQAYGLLNWRHVLDLLNEQLLVAPAAVLVLVGVRGAVREKGSDERSFFAVAGIFPFIFTALANPEIGAFRDWDVLAFPALPLSLWAACVLLDRGMGPGPWLVCGAAALHTFTWIGINAEAAAGIARYEALLIEGALSKHGRAYGWETLGAFYREVDRREDSLRAFAQAVAADPRNVRFRVAMARDQLALRKSREASQTLLAALEIDGEQAHIWDLLGTAYTADGDYLAGIAAHRRALDLQGRDGVVWYNLGNAYLLVGDAAAAVDAYRQAAVWGVQRAELSYNRGLAHEALEQWPAARASYEEALGVNPNYAVARARLGEIIKRQD